MGVNLEKEWYSTEEAQALTGYDSRKITKYIREGKITNYKREGYYYFINKEVIQELIEKETYLSNNYYTYKEVAVVLNKSLKAVNEMVYANKFNDVKRNGTNGYIRKEEVEGYIVKTNGRLTRKEVAEITGLSRFEVDTLIQRNFRSRASK